MFNFGSGGPARGAAAQPTSQQDYYKSLLPSQLLAERGAEVVVINPGSANVRISLASAKSPISVPHCIAHHLRTSCNEHAAESSQKGAVGEHLFGSTPLSTTRMNEREEVLEAVASQLKLRPFYSESGKVAVGDLEKCVLLPKDRDTGFEWTCVEDGAPVGNAAGWTHQPPSGSSVKSIADGAEGATQGDNQEDHSLKNKSSASGSTEGGTPQKESGRPRRFRKYVCGEDSLKIPAGQPYRLYRPMCRGRLNISSQYSLQQVCDDIYRIWDYVLTEKCYIGAKMRPRLSAVLVVPDTLDNREVKELLSVVLRDLQFHSAVVIQECVAATFGNGVSSGCIVNMGAQVTSVMCIEEGVAIPSTRFVLPFGGDDITRCFLWVQQQKRMWPLPDTDPLHDPLDFQTISKLKETHCILSEGEQRITAEVRCRMAGEPTRVYNVLLSSLNVPPMGLFYPSLLALEEYAPLPRQWHHADYEDLMDDNLPEAVRRFEANEPGLVNGNNNGASVPGTNEDSDPYDFEDNTKKPVEELSIGLPQAIVKSILSLGRVDLQKKHFASIQLVGGVGSTKGLVDAIEERVLHAIPADEAVDTVEVLPTRLDPATAMWKGGAVLAVLDFGRDLWVQYEDWLDGMVMVGSGRKYRDSNTLQAQAFWYSAMLD